MELVICRTHRNYKYTTINLTCVQDARLSGLAKALHLYAVSRPDGWKLYMADLALRFKEGRDAIYKALKELEETGYMRREQTRNGKRYGQVVMSWYEEPNLQLPESQDTESQDTKTQDTESQHTESSYPMNPTLSNNQSSNDQDSKNQDSKIASGCPRCRKPSTAQSGVNYLLQRMHDIYGGVFGHCPLIVEGRNQKQLKTLLDHGFSEEVILARYKQYLSIDDKWFKDHGYDIQTFAGQFDGIGMRLENGHGKSSGAASGKRSDYIQQLAGLDDLIHR